MANALPAQYLRREKLRDFAGKIRARLAKGGKAVGDAEKEDQSDGAAIYGAGPRNYGIEARMMSTCIEGTAKRGRHQCIHRYKANCESTNAKHATGTPTEIGG
jgi:hypothetical protein